MNLEILIKKVIRKIKSIKKLFTNENNSKIIAKRRAFYRQFLNEGDVYFDIGANIGNRIQPLINQGIKIIAVEPQYECVKVLEKKFGDKITIVQKGLGSKVEEKEMYISNANTISSFSKEWIDSTKASGRFSQFNWNSKRLIQIDTLNNLLDLYGDASFIKIDVEGYELEVLKGLSKPVKCISFEYTVPEQIDNALNCLKRLMKIYENSILCNYSKKESMEWAMDKWITPKDMLLEINSPEFISSFFGDIYVKYNKV